MSKRNKFSNGVAILLISLPLLVYWVYATYISFDYPFERADPEYTYFLTSLAPFKGGEYRYVDHPGTPVEVIGSVLLGVTYPFVSDRGLSEFIQYHLDEPHLFFLMAHGFLLVSSIVCAIYFYRTALVEQRWEDILIAVSLALMYYAIYSNAFPTLRLWSHNSFGFPFGTLILLFLYRLVNNSGEISKKNIILLAIGSGTLTAVVIYFCTWVLGIAITIGVFYWAQGLPPTKIVSDIKTFLGFCFLGFILAILPAIKNIYIFVVWIIFLITHQGQYGNGEVGFTSLPLLASNFSSLYKTNQNLFLVIGFSFVFLVLAILQGQKILSRKPGLSALGIGLSIQILSSILIIAKHPATAYLSSVAAAAPVLVLTVKELFQEKFFTIKMLNWLLIFLVAAGIVVNLTNSMRTQKEHIQALQALNSETSRIISERALATGRNPDDFVIVWGQGVLVPCNTLARANRIFVHAFNKELAIGCDNQYFINDVVYRKPIIAAPLFADLNMVDITELKWDFTIVQNSFLGNSLPLLPPIVNIQDLGGISIISNE